MPGHPIKDELPVISVVIPTYHRNDLLARCLDCLAPGKQTLPSDKYLVIVADDGTDSSAEQMIADRYPWASWTAGPRRGPAANRNHGASQVRGDWLVFTDDDCVPSHSWLSAFHAASASNADAYEGMTTCEQGVRSPLEESPINTTGGYLWSCNMMIRRKLFSAMNGFHEQFPTAAMEDIEFHGRLKDANSTIEFVPAAIVDHPPRRRRIGLKSARQWESRILMEALRGPTLRESLPVHVLKVRLSQLFAFPPSKDWFTYLLSLPIEVVVVAIRSRAWRRSANLQKK